MLWCPMSGTCRLDISYRSMTAIFGIVVIAIRRAVMLLRQSPINISRKASIRCLSWEIARVSWLRAVRSTRGSIPPPRSPYFSRFSTHATTSGLSSRIAVNTLRKFQVSPTQALRNFTNETNRFTVINEQEEQLEIVLRRSLLTTASK